MLLTTIQLETALIPNAEHIGPEAPMVSHLLALFKLAGAQGLRRLWLLLFLHFSSGCFRRLFLRRSIDDVIRLFFVKVDRC